MLIYTYIKITLIILNLINPTLINAEQCISKNSFINTI